MSDFDSPWKEALHRFLPAFLRFFFPKVDAAVDWSRGYESLDKELQQIVREGELGKRLADTLLKVWRPGGEEAWLLIHVEVQNQPEADFPERMFVYFLRIFDRFHRPPVSLAVLGDDQPNWRPDTYVVDQLGCENRFRFPTVKLLDYLADLAILEQSDNPFAALVLAHLQAHQTRHDHRERLGWKLRIIKGLFGRGLNAEEIRQLFRLIDWLMDLPRELERDFIAEIHRFEEEKKMPYVTSVERLAREDGREEGLVKGREEGREEGAVAALRKTLLRQGHKRFGPPDETTTAALEAIANLERLERLSEQLLDAKDWSDLLATP